MASSTTTQAFRRTLLFILALVAVAVLWELYKLIGPVDGGSILGWEIIPKTNDAAMPHAWDIVTRLGEPESSALDEPIVVTVLRYGWYTFRLALLGMVIGAVVGTVLAVLMARFDVAERGLLPWVIASQTVPLIALAPQVVSWSGRLDLFGWEVPRWFAVSLLAAFLAFFPVSIGTLRGLKSTPEASLELMDSYAASWTTTLFKLRFPAAVPFIMTSLKLAATASVVGVIVAEVSTGIRGGIGRAVISYGQARTGDPEKLFAAVLASAMVGLAMYGLVVVADTFLNRHRPKETPT